ncbi:hypothetical protein [Photobacterium leiognathi]|uniref:hypothetical protein n=1 Tax=Photobacterium leiognathi TaxID=553611 RepID=UPI002739F5A0|nr:hypothetical protein [Photobacterium leiognathi]
MKITADFSMTLKDVLSKLSPASNDVTQLTDYDQFKVLNSLRHIGNSVTDSLICDECGSFELVTEDALEVDSGDGRLIQLTLCSCCFHKIANEEYGIDA